MAFAKCVRHCPFAYGGCEKVGVRIHPTYTRNENLLRDERGNYFCHNGKLLTVFDNVCEKCGDELKPAPEESEEGLLGYKCPSCQNIVKMEV